jgi:hypothetical protein
MSTLTTNVSAHTNSGKTPEPFSLASFIAALFAVELREELDAKTGGDKSDAAFTWGM